jgi:hypothetical protein
VEGKEEQVPDYEITEDTGEEHPEEEGDKRLGKTRDGEERPRLSNREKRQLRKKKLAQKFDEKDRLIRQQQEMINQLAGRVNDVDSRLAQVDQAQLQQAWNDTTAVFAQAEAEHALAFKNQDGAAATRAMRKMYDAQKRLDELQIINARLQQRQPIQSKEEAPKANPVVANRAQEWAKRNPWFKADGSDDDSAIANTIATRLVSEGFDATSDEYWEELDNRLAARGIGDEADDEQDDPPPHREQAKEQQAPRRSPPVSGSGGRGDLGNGKTQIKLPTAYINTLKENGYWDDPEKRNRMIKRYLDGLKERQSEGVR